MCPKRIQRLLKIESVYFLYKVVYAEYCKSFTRERDKLTFLFFLTIEHDYNIRLVQVLQLHLSLTVFPEPPKVFEINQNVFRIYID